MSGAEVRDMIAGTYGEGSLRIVLSYYARNPLITVKRGEIKGFVTHRVGTESHVGLQITDTTRTTPIYARSIKRKTDKLPLPQDRERADVTILPDETTVKWEIRQRGGKHTSYELKVPTF